MGIYFGKFAQVACMRNLRIVLILPRGAFGDAMHACPPQPLAYNGALLYESYNVVLANRWSKCCGESKRFTHTRTHMMYDMHDGKYSGSTN